MAESGGGGEKTEKPTAKKRKDERKEGHVLQSKEVATVFSLIVVFVAFKFLYNIILSTLGDSLESYISISGKQNSLDMAGAIQIFIDGVKTIAITALPLLLIAGVAGIIPVIAQTKGLVSFKSIKPKFSNMNPLQGIKRMISLKGIMELLKAIIKIIILGVLIYNTVKDDVTTLSRLMQSDVTTTASFVGATLFAIVKNVAIAYAFVALFDFIYEKLEFEKKMRMSKQEIKEEYKQTEGDPQIKGKIRQIQRQRAMNRMMQKVPEADVIIRNPTHYAIAIKYESKENNAPIVIAKGKDYVALRIIEVAKKHDIEMTENRPLARALYEAVDVGREIPPEFYKPVADVLAFVYKLRKKELK